MISLDDFLLVFSASITQARHELQDEEALQSTTIKRYEETMRRSMGATDGEM